MKNLTELIQDIKAPNGKQVFFDIAQSFKSGMITEYQMNFLTLDYLENCLLNNTTAEEIYK